MSRNTMIFEQNALLKKTVADNQNQINGLFALYIHWPYCLSKCPYCDFASSVCKSPDESALLTGYLRDLDIYRAQFGRPLTSIFFGGGTPSIMSAAFLKRLMNEIKGRFSFSNSIEITMEANPDAIDADKMKAFKDCGINRLSIGVQSLRQNDLHFLGRRHSVQTALRRIEEASEIFSRVNMDLIYARPGQTAIEWETELKEALDLGLSHYSLYQLTLEEGTPFYKQGIETPSEETARDLYILTDEIMKKADVPSYEVSNYAKAGQESIHNLTYWLGKDYLGIGPAAHGRIGLTATSSPTSVHEWIQNGPFIETLTSNERFEEKVLMGLRLTHTPFPIKGLSKQGLNRALELKWIEGLSDGIIPTLEGTLMLNELILMLLPNGL